jgi:chemotaxis family two-component system response regulator Rcp1
MLSVAAHLAPSPGAIPRSIPHCESPCGCADAAYSTRAVPQMLHAGSGLDIFNRSFGKGHEMSLNTAAGAMPVEILLVEDSAGDVRLTQEALRDAKVRNNLHVATDGMEAMSFLCREGAYASVPRPDLILLDLNLPKMSGRDVLKNIKQDVNLKTIPVVILTTSAAEEDIFRSYQLHANCYITKPVDLDQFLKVVMTIDNFWLAIVKLPRT